MKKTININLAGYPFIIDEDAYNLLKDYLDTIRFAFKTSEDTEDLASDIENRIAEILIEKEHGGVRIVSAEEISSVIARIGKPSEFMETTEEISENDDPERVKEEIHTEEIEVEEVKPTPPPYESKTRFANPLRKKLYRDPQNSMIGGVCAGLAYYLNVDVTIIRLLTVVLFFLSASTVAIVYIVLWIVVPAANTPFQRMQMKGEDPTVENIGRKVTENYRENSEDVSQDGTFSSFLNTCFSIFVKCLIVLGLIVAIPLLIAFGIGLMGCVAAVMVIGFAYLGGASVGPNGMFDSPQECLMVFFILLAVIGGLLTLGIPLWLLLRKLWKKKDGGTNPSNRNALLIAWLCGIALLSVFTVKAVRKGVELERLEQEESVELAVDPEEDISEDKTINIGPSGVTIKKKDKTIVINNGGVEVEVKEEVEKTLKTDSIEQ